MNKQLVLLFSIGFFFVMCSKSSNGNSNINPVDTTHHVTLTRLLTNLCLDSTKYYMQGQWKWVCTRGGIGGPGMVSFYTKKIMNIDTLSKNIQEIDNGYKYIDTTFDFVKKYNIYTGNDSIIALHYEGNVTTNQRGARYYFPYKIINDSLVIRQYGPDGSDFYLIRQ